MTIKSALIRFLKETGYYGILLDNKNMHFIKANYNKSAYIFSNSVLIILIKSVPLDIYSEIVYFKERCIINKFSRNIKDGDIVTVRSLDGKYSFDYKVFTVYYSDYTFVTKKGTKIEMERIIAVNGKPVDFVNGWEFKKDINNLHINGKRLL